MASKFIALFALVAVAHAQHYSHDYQQNYQQNYDHHYASPAVIKTIQPAVIKHVQPAIIKQVQPALIKKVAYEHHENHYEAPANYEFNYDVHDPHTGDIKQQHEVAKDGAVSGEYSLIDADGYRRIVSYTADDHHGFIAQVKREPVEGHKFIAQPVAKVIAQPAIAIKKIVAPVQYAAPAQQYQQYSAPSQNYHYSAPAQQYQQYSAPAQNYHYSQPGVHYSAPAVKVAVPVVQKYIAPAPVVEKYVAPVVQKYISAPVVQKYVQAPIVKAVAAPVKYSSAEHSAHVSVNAPHFNYHY